MVFAKATSDIAFKKLFGDPTRTHLPISFLNAVLERKEGERIIELTIIDPANQPEIIMIDKPTAVQEWELQQKFEEGQKIAKLEVAKSLLTLMSVEQIAQATGLSIQDIEQLKQESK